MLLKNKVNSTYLYIHENEDECIQQTTLKFEIFYFFFSSRSLKTSEKIVLLS